jgi:predicted Zn finger-like uncharacterized protein
MYTQCPDCLTIYRIGAESLAGGRGSFRCGHCATVFDALPTLIEKLPLEVVGELPRHPAPNAPPLLAVPAMHPQPRQVSMFDAEHGKQSSARVEPVLDSDWFAQIPPTLNDSVGRANFDVRDPARTSRSTGSARSDTVSPVLSANRPAPSYAQGRSYRHDPPSRAWVWGSVLLVCTLAGQIAWAERQRLLAEPALRQGLEMALGWFGQRLPLLVKLDALTLVSREVRPHGDVPGALLISAAMRNDSSSVLAYPRIEIRMTDLTGKPVALRRFTPDDYLGDPAGQLAGLQPGALVPLVFEVVDPGRDALNYEFAFRTP